MDRDTIWRESRLAGALLAAGFLMFVGACSERRETRTRSPDPKYDLEYANQEGQEQPLHITVVSGNRDRMSASEYETLLARVTSEAETELPHLIVFPDRDFLPRDGSGDPSQVAREEALLSKLARQFGVWLAASYWEQDESGGGDYRTCALVSPTGSTLSRTRKNLFEPDTPAGTFQRAHPKTFISPVFTAGAWIASTFGSDLQWSVMRLAERGAEVVIVPSRWGEQNTPADTRATMRRLAEEHNVIIACADASENQQEPRGGIWVPGKPAEVVASETLGFEISSARVTAERNPFSRSSLGIPPAPFPRKAQVTPAVVKSGERLFFDKGLSRDGSVSCGTCHLPDKFYTDGGRVVAVGAAGRSGRRNVPSLLNVAFRHALFWDGYAYSLESQVKYPINHLREMDSDYLSAMLEYVNSKEDYREALAGGGRLDYGHISNALSAFQRTLISGDSKFDRYHFAGEKNALSKSQVRGFEIFEGKGRCVTCHTISEGYALFSDQKFHNTGVAFRTEIGQHADLGSYMLDLSGREGMFLTPSLRNVSKTAPYMHDGSILTLADVVKFYNQGGHENPHLSEEIRPLKLSDGERSDLVEFLHGLTSMPESGGSERTGQELASGSDRETLLVGDSSGGADCALSPDGAKIAISSRRTGNWEIFIYDIAERVWSQVTDHPSDDFEPAWHPDGESIAFVSTRRGSKDVMIADLESGEVFPVSHEKDTDEEYPAWSPDGEKIVFTGGPFPDRVFYVADIGSGAMKALPVRQGQLGAATFGAASSEIYFHAYRQGNADLYRYRFSDRSATQLTETEGWEYKPDLSPDGKLLAYSVTGGGSTHINVLRTSDNKVFKVSHDPKQERWPTWAADRKLLWHRISDRVNELVVYDLADEKVIHREPAGERSLNQGAISAGGTELVVSGKDERGGFLEVVNIATGSTEEIIVRAGSEFAFPTLSPSGRSIAYLNREDHGWSIRVVARELSQERVLVRPTKEYSKLLNPVAWNKNGSLLFFSAEVGPFDSDLFSVDVRTGEVVRVTSGLAYDEAPSLSACGTKLLFMSTRGGDWSWGLYSLDLADRDQIECIAAPRELEQNYPHETSDGMLISTHASEAGVRTLAIHRRGEGVAAVEALGTSINWPSIASDGKYVVCASLAPSVEYHLTEVRVENLEAVAAGDSDPQGSLPGEEDGEDGHPLSEAAAQQLGIGAHPATVLHFFATWCPSCIGEIQRLESIAERVPGVNIVHAVRASGAVEGVRRWVQENHLDIVPLDGAMLLDDPDRVAYYPTTFLFSRDGEMVKKFVGSREAEVFERALRDLVQAD